jgi:hypothetical protein
MLPKNFKGCNIRYGKPKGWTDEQCIGIDAMRFTDQSTGGQVIRTLWMPSKEDIEAINEGSGIVLDMHIPVMVPVALFTIDKNGNIN